MIPSCFQVLLCSKEIQYFLIKFLKTNKGAKKNTLVCTLECNSVKENSIQMSADICFCGLFIDIILNECARIYPVSLIATQSNSHHIII